MKSLQEIFFRTKTHSICFGFKKCSFISSDRPIKILGLSSRTVNALLILPALLQFSNCLSSKSVGDLRSFIGSINYLRDWIPGLSALLAPLTALTKTPRQQNSESQMDNSAH
ncbi:hypothetical protein GEMRC1_013416 [Eukaryota sp. GEM-RC1]